MHVIEVVCFDVVKCSLRDYYHFQTEVVFFWISRFYNVLTVVICWQWWGTIEALIKKCFWNPETLSDATIIPQSGSVHICIRADDWVQIMPKISARHLFKFFALEGVND